MQSTSYISNLKSLVPIMELVTTKQTEEDKVLPNYILLQICTLILLHSMKIVLPVPDNWKNISDQHEARKS